MKINELYDLNYTTAADYLNKFTYPWEALKDLENYIVALGKTLDREEYSEVSPSVWIHKSVKISGTAHLGAPCIVGENTEIRHCAFIRGSALIGKNCVIGNSTELKNVILFDKVQTPHFNYAGDSILGYRAHMGAGAIISNVKSDKTLITVHGTKDIPTGRKKFGAAVGDYAEIGCNSVLNPGTVVGKNTIIYPLSSVRGVIAPDSIFKSGGNIAVRR